MDLGLHIVQYKAMFCFVLVLHKNGATDKPISQFYFYKDGCQKNYVHVHEEG